MEAITIEDPSSHLLRSSPNQSKSSFKVLFRKWNRLSRLQRSIIYSVTVILTIAWFYFYVGYQENDNLLFKKRHQVNEDQITSHKSSINLPELDEKTDGRPLKERKGDVVKQIIEDNEENKAMEDFEHVVTGNENYGNSNRAEELEERNIFISFNGPGNARQRAVVDAFKHAWKGYKTHAWGHDHLKPVSRGTMNWSGLGMTIIDSLDTMILMNLVEEFKESKKWITEHLNFNVKKDVNLFETTIRLMGGLLSAFHLTGKKNSVFLEKAVDLGNRLLGGFHTSSGIPFADINLGSSKGHAPNWNPDSSTSEVTTIQLEFRDLSRCSGNPDFENAAFGVSTKVHENEKFDGLVPIFINTKSGKFRKSSTITLGARGDSYYEYLLKQWIQTGKIHDFLKEDYLAAVEGIQKWLVKRTVVNKYLFLGEVQWGGSNFKPKMDELVCFLPGTLALGAHHGMPNSHMRLAEDLIRTCYKTFAENPTHLAAEINYFNYKLGSEKDFYIRGNDAHYLLRPETLESLWYMYYFTGEKMYQDWGWNIFQGIEKYAKVVNGYTTIGDVRNPANVRPKDLMETYFLSETLKYLYLLFSDRKDFDLTEWVFNTEGHPLPIYSH